MAGDNLTKQEIQPGAFVVFEGLDGAGTTTQIRRLDRWLYSRGILSEVSSEPSNGPLGAILRGAIEGRINFTAHTMALAFAADRLDHLSNPVNGIVTPLHEGRWVLCDRYVLSSLVYQLREGVDLDWLLSINRFAITPDVTVFVDTPTEQCLRRIDSRTSNYALFHNKSDLERTLQNYRSIVAKGDKVGHLITVDGSRTEDEVFLELVEQFEDWMDRARVQIEAKTLDDSGSERRRQAVGQIRSKRRTR